MKNHALQIKGLKEERAAKVQALDNIAQIIETRAFTADEQKQYNNLKKEIEDITSRLSVVEESESRALKGAKPLGSEKSESNQDSDDESAGFTILKRVKVDRERPITDFHLRNYDVDPVMQKANVYKVLRAMATGKAPDTATTHALNETRGITGGTSLLNPFLGSQLIDGMLPKSRLARAGMRVIPLESGTHKLAKIDTYPVFEWKEELGTTTERSTTFTSVEFEAKTLRGYVPVSGELLMDGRNFEQALKRAMTHAAAQSIDEAGLVGTGSGAVPTGVKNYTNINKYTMSGTHGGRLSNWDPVLETVKLILDDNGESPTAAIMNPREWMEVNRVVDDENAWKYKPEALRDMQIFETSVVPTNLTKGGSTVCSQIYFGGFDSLYMGIRSEVQVQILPVNVANYSYDFFLTFRGDFQPTHEQSFGMIDCINPYAS